MRIPLPFDILTVCTEMWGDDFDLVGVVVLGEVLRVVRWLFLID